MSSNQKKHPEFNRIMIGLLSAQELLVLFKELSGFFGEGKIPVPYDYADRRRKNSALARWLKAEAVLRHSGEKDFRDIRLMLGILERTEYHDPTVTMVGEEIRDLTGIIYRSMYYGKAVCELLHLWGMEDELKLFRSQIRQLANMRNHAARINGEKGSPLMRIPNVSDSQHSEGNCYVAGDHYLPMIIRLQKIYLRMEQLQCDVCRLDFGSRSELETIFRQLGLPLTGQDSTNQKMEEFFSWVITAYRSIAEKIAKEGKSHPFRCLNSNIRFYQNGGENYEVLTWDRRKITWWDVLEEATAVLSFKGREEIPMAWVRQGSFWSIVHSYLNLSLETLSQDTKDWYDRETQVSRMHLRLFLKFREELAVRIRERKNRKKRR
jgi:hypothetical protein